jgi:hypothetical protein
MPSRLRALIALSAILILPARSAFAQSLRASASADLAVANHNLIGSPLYGASLRMDKALTDGVALRFGAERVSGSASRSGVACGGFVLRPELCPTEVLVDDATLTTGGAGLAFWTETREGLVLNLTGDLRAGVVQSTTQGSTTGNAIDADKVLAGIDVGAEASWMPCSASACVGVRSRRQDISAATSMTRIIRMSWNLPPADFKRRIASQSLQQEKKS